ncbi:hypothetical protein CHLRE_12g502250v5 [Chlamydomonas reinhardtii]|uniref:Plastid lipid-associated protein/fibrillin conserved domain-containing protein n=1 Tax=Chlamydomonas reinhardtii TaxID=3055 RepID=A0A2K3D377_CHLRE|nr:uncharacterized protein CHLRE_12g502250v5 [Chlamydomonas reinhardtii]PNW74967.1 hypothetical protein CHLRE_12g502250v5 [Chlamydomonas reinhardtii]
MQLMRQPTGAAPARASSRAPALPVLPHHRQQRLRHRGLHTCRTASGTTSDKVALESPASNAATDAAPAAAVAHAAAPEDARAIVDEVLKAIEGTDSGLSIDPATRKHVDGLLDKLEALGAAQQPRPLDSPLLWGNYNVAYTSVGRSQERGEPAGGRFRGKIGRALFRTAGLFQSVLQPDIATNKVEFKLFGMLPGFVGLRGRVVPQGDAGDTVQVLFEPPVLAIADKLFLCIGRTSSVVLSTTYLDERIRLGKGSRGSLFVFTRGGAADAAGMDQVGLQRTSLTAAALFSAFFVSLFAAGWLLWATANPLGRAAAVAFWLLGAAVGGVVRQGGLVMDREDERMVAAAQAALAEKERKDKERKEEAGGGAEAGAGGVTPAAA